MKQKTFTSSLNPRQIYSISRLGRLILIVIVFWFARGQQNTGFSYLLLSYGIILVEQFLFESFSKFTKQDFNKKKHWNLIWLLSSVVLGTILVCNVVFNFRDLIFFTMALRLILIGALGLIFELVLKVWIENKTLKMEFFRNQAGWILILFTGISMYFSEIVVLDIVIGLGFLIYFISKKYFQQEIFNSIKDDQKNDIPKTVETEQTSNKKKINSYRQLDSKILTEIVSLEKIEKLYDFKSIETEQEGLVVYGNLVVSNQAKAEEIYEVKQKTKKILKNNNYPLSVIEVKYEYEFEQEQQLQKKEN